MDVNLVKYYEERFSMMATPGWAALIEDVNDMLKTTDSLNGITDEKSLHYRKGELSIMRWITSLKEVSEKAYTDLQNDED